MAIFHTQKTHCDRAAPFGIEPKRVCSVAARRAGLAPLELVLAIPIILFIFALILNAGYSGMWKLRGLGIAREAAWSTRTDRSAKTPPTYREESWKSPTPTSSTGGAALLTSVDKPQVDKPVVRGPTIGSLEVDRDLLDPSRHTYQGESSTTRPFPLLPDSLSHLKYDLDHELLRNPLPYWKTRLSWNIERRTRVIYNPSGNGIVKEFESEWQDYINSANSAVAAVEGGLQNSNLLPLGHFYYGEYHDPDTERLQWHNPAINYQYALLREYHEGYLSPPGFMPPLSIVTSLDYQWVYDTMVAPLIDKIREDPLRQSASEPFDEPEGSLPYSLASSYINFFNSAIQIVQEDVNQINRFIDDINQESNPNADELAHWQAALSAAEAELAVRHAELDPKIAELTNFRSRF